MSDVPPQEGVPELGAHSLLELFNELSFKEKWKRVMAGLKMPHDTGEYKWARFQMQRLMAPATAIVGPIIAILLLIVMSSAVQEKAAKIEVEVMEAEETPELDEIEVLEEEPPEPPEPVEVDLPPSDFAGPSDNTAVTPGPDADFSPTPAPMDAVAIVKSPVVMKGILGSRTPGHRGSALGKYGGSGRTEDAVIRALRWLKATQESEGCWPQNKCAMTALALLTFLAHGETPAAEEFGPTVERAIRYLVESQEDGGNFSPRDSHDYTHPIVTYALAEAYGMTKVPTIKYAAEKAAKLVIQGQHPSGGWDYNLKQSDRDDTSYMGWCAQALKAIKIAKVFDGDEEWQTKLEKACKQAIAGFQKNYKEDGGYGGFGYTSPSAKNGLTGVGVLCMQLLGAAKQREVRNGLAGLADCPFSWKKEEIASPYNKCPVYYWYYITQAKFHEGGATWDTWNKLFSPVLVNAQQVMKGGGTDGKDIGYWNSPGEAHVDAGKGLGGGSVMETCLSALMLQVYYRYLPTFATPVDDAVPAEQAGGGGKDLDIDVVL